MPEAGEPPCCSVCGPVDEPLAVHVTTKHHQTLAAMENEMRPQQVPDWVSEVMPNAGQCLLCGVPGADQRHRVLDAIAERVQAGDGEDEVAEDYGYPVSFVERVAREWNPS